MIRFFISSTFKDMHEERRHLHARVLPRVRAFAETLGEYVDLCDLRWGIDLSDEADGDAVSPGLMSSCLDAIDACDGYVISLLGDSYGTQLRGDEAHVLQEIWTSRRHEALDSYEISLTQMEVEYGLFHGDRDRCLCFRRTCPGSPTGKPEQARRQRDLIERVRDSGARYAEYQAAWDAVAGGSVLDDGFDQLLIEAMKEAVRRKADAQRHRNWVEREWDAAHAMAEELSRGFAGRRDQLEELDRLVASHPVVTVFGASGIGKSALLAHWLYSRHLLHQTTSCYVACGRGVRSNTVLDVAIQLIFFLENAIHETDEEHEKPPRDKLVSESDAIKLLSNLMHEYDAALERRGQEGLIVLDAINQLNSLSGEGDFLWLHGLQLSRLHVVTSSIEGPGARPAPEASPADVTALAGCLELQPLTDADIEDIVGHDMQVRGRLTTEMIIEPIKAKADHAKPLYLRGVLDVLKMGLGHLRPGSNRQVFEQHRATIERLGGTVDELIWQVFGVAAEYVGGSVVQGADASVEDHRSYLGLLATSLYGVADEDALDVLAAQSAAWNARRAEAFEALLTRCRLFLRSFYRCDQVGRWTFGHDLVRTSVEAHLPVKQRQRALCVYGAHREAGCAMTEARRTLVFYDVTSSSLDQGNLDLVGTLLDEASQVETFEKARHDRHEPHHYTSSSGLVAQALDDFLRTHGPDEYLALVDRHPRALEHVLTVALTPVENRIDANRRISAMAPAELLARTLREGGAPATLSFHWFLKQLIDIYDDTSQQERALEFMAPARDFVCAQHVRGQGAEEQLQLVALANLVFYCANKLIKPTVDAAFADEEALRQAGGRIESLLEAADGDTRRAFAISNDLLAWFDREVRDGSALADDPRIAERRAAYINNIGQRHNALRRVDLGFPYRMHALRSKVTSAFEILGLRERLAAYLALCPDDAPQTVERHEGLACAHDRYWRELALRDVLATAHEGRLALRYLQSIAQTYRALGSDYFHWPALCPSIEQTSWYRVGLHFFDLAVSLVDASRQVASQEGDLQERVNQKELAVALIRIVGMRKELLVYLAEADPQEVGHEVELFCDATERALVAYLNDARFDHQEGRKLHEAIAQAADALGKGAGALGTLAADARTQYVERLERMDYQLDID